METANDGDLRQRSRVRQYNVDAIFKPCKDNAVYDKEQERIARNRIKNREAQQRFRERQRAKRNEIESVCKEMEDEYEDLQKENAALRQRNLAMEKILVVRDALIAAYLQTSSKCSRKALSTECEPQKEELEKINSLVSAVQELPTACNHGSHVQSVEFLASKPKSSISCQAEHHPKEEKMEKEEGAEVSDAPFSILQGSTSSGLPDALSNSVEISSESLPPASDPTIISEIKAMVHPTDLVDYWRKWTLDLRAAWENYEKCPSEEAKIAIGKCNDRMKSIWWHAAQLQPSHLLYLTYAALPAESAQHSQWRVIAQHVLKELTKHQLGILRKAWRQYRMRLSAITVDVEIWTRKVASLNLLANAPSMSASASANLDVSEVSAKLSVALQEEYLATMEFLANQMDATTDFQKAYMNYAALPFMPDVVAIVFHILNLAEGNEP